MKGSLRTSLRCLLSSAALLTVFTHAETARAQTQFTSMTVFGESYADRGNVLCFLANGFANCPYPSHNPYPSNPATDATQIVPFSLKLQQLYNLPNAAAFDYAIAGSTAYSGPNGLSEAAQVDAFINSGRHFGPSDLVAVQFIGNDGINSAFVQNLTHVPTAFDTGNPVVDAQNEAARDAANLQRLVNAGLKTIAWLAPGDVALKPIGQGPSIFGTPAFQSSFHAYYNAAFDALQNDLRPFALSGTRIFLFDLRVFEQRLNANPQQYGFPTMASAFRPDGLHYNEVGFGLIARYMQNQIDAPTIVAQQGSLVLATAGNFAEAAFGRLDAYRNISAYGSGSAYNAYAADVRMPTKALPAVFPAEQRWSAYGEVNYAGGNLDGQLFGTAANYNSFGGTVGIEYLMRPDWKLGGVFSYMQPNVNFATQNAHLKMDALQFGGYSSYTARNWFADALVAYSRQIIHTDRAGIIDTINGSTNADLFTIAAKAGYLFDVAPLRVGPIGGLSYTHASIGGYTETGDVLLTQIVNAQNIDSLTGSAGIQLRMPFTMTGALYSPYVNVTAEHDFLGDGRIITTAQSTTLLLPVMTPVNATNQTYGKVVTGIAGRLWGNVSGQINAYSTFARNDGNFYGVNGGIKVAF
ncbi:outer membrane lipase/esterase [Bradyrhizobium sp. USDA 4516]